LIEKLKWEGIFKIKTINKNGEVKEETIKNRITDDALIEIVKTLHGEAPDLEIAYLALGTDSTAVTDGATALGNEIFRTQPVSVVASGTGEVTSVFLVLYDEANDDIKEIGIFCGATATEDPDTGILLSRILWSKTKNENIEFDITRVDSLGRG